MSLLNVANVALLAASAFLFGFRFAESGWDWHIAWYVPLVLANAYAVVNRMSGNRRLIA